MSVIFSIDPGLGAGSICISSGGHIWETIVVVDNDQGDNPKRRGCRSMRRQIRRRVSRKIAVSNILRHTIYPDFDPKTTLDNVDIKELRNRILNYPDSFVDKDDFLKSIAKVVFMLSTNRGRVYGIKNEKKINLKKKIHHKREDSTDDFDTIMQIGTNRYPDVFTTKNTNSIKDILYFERGVEDKSDKIGKCSLMENEKRTHAHVADFQKFSIRTSLSNITVEVGNESIPLCKYEKLIENMEVDAFNKGLTWNQIDQIIQNHLGPNVSYHGIDASVKGQQKVGRNGIGPANLDVVDKEGKSNNPTTSISIKAANILYDRMVSKGIREGEAKQELIDEGVFKKPFNKNIVPARNTILTIDELFDYGIFENNPLIISKYRQWEKIINECVKRYSKYGHIEIRIECQSGAPNEYNLRNKFKDKYKHIVKIRRNRERNESIGSKKTINRLFAIRGNKCFISDLQANEKGHLIPRSIGAGVKPNGTLEISNLIPINREVNELMDNKTIYEAFRKTKYWDIIQRNLKSVELKKDSEIKYLKRKLKTISASSECDDKTKKEIKDLINAEIALIKYEWKTFVWRFQSNARDKFLSDFRPHSLEDMNNIEKMLCLGVSTIDKNPMMISGGLTHSIRTRLGIPKNRKTHRHHAEDAAIIASINRDSFESIKNKKECNYKDTMFNADAITIIHAGETATIIHRVKKSLQGKLHEDTFAQHKFNEDGTKAFFRKKGEKRNVGHYRSYVKFGSGNHVRYAKPGGNIYFEVYERSDGQWEGVSVSRFDANQKGYRAGQTCKPKIKIGEEYKPDARAKLKMRLYRNQVIRIFENGESKLLRIQKMSGDKIYVLDTDDAITRNGKPHDGKWLKKVKSKLVHYSATKEAFI